MIVSSRKLGCIALLTYNYLQGSGHGHCDRMVSGVTFIVAAQTPGKGPWTGADARSSCAQTAAGTWRSGSCPDLATIVTQATGPCAIGVRAKCIRPGARPGGAGGRRWSAGLMPWPRCRAGPGYAYAAYTRPCCRAWLLQLGLRKKGTRKERPGQPLCRADALAAGPLGVRPCFPSGLPFPEL